MSERGRRKPLKQEKMERWKGEAIKELGTDMEALRLTRAHKDSQNPHSPLGNLIQLGSLSFIYLFFPSDIWENDFKR